MAIKVWLPEGIQEPFHYTITEKPRIISAFPYKWFQVTITNDDKNNTLYCTTNAQPRINPTILEPGESVEHDYDKPTIWQVVLWTDAGKTAKARIDAMR